MAGSLTSKLADTVSSEIGKAYGKTAILSTTWRRVPPGTEGAVSVEGTGAGMGAAVGFSLLAGMVGVVPWGWAGVGSVVVAAVVANYLESVAGAVWQDSIPWLTNDVVNMIQISGAALMAMGLFAWRRGGGGA